MPSNEQRRQAAKRKLERQLARRVERAKQRRRRLALGSGVAVVVVLLVVFGVIFLVGGHGSTSSAAGTTTTSAAPKPVTTSGPCKYTSTPTQPAPKGKDEGMPSDPNPTPKTGTVTVTLQTSQGDIPLVLDRAQAPCTVQSFVHLAQKGYFDATMCHRLTADPTLKVLQCGDPTGSGEGGPGYTIPDENPKNLKAAPTTAPAQPGQPAMDIYPAGTIAMANTGQPNSGGSQFFLVYGDTQLPAVRGVRHGQRGRHDDAEQDRGGRHHSGHQPADRRADRHRRQAEAAGEHRQGGRGELRDSRSGTMSRVLRPNTVRRAVIGLFGPVTALLVLTGCTVTVTGLPVFATPPPPATMTTPALPVVSSGPCRYTTTTKFPAPQGKVVGLPGDPTPTLNSGTVALTLQTTQGPMPLTLDRGEAPCTVQSFLFLAQQHFFDNTQCHRLTADPTLKVLQCGDPTGTGQGGPGYTIPDEKPTALTPAQDASPGTPVDVYPAGTVAMANTGEPDSGGSQFFLVYADSELPPTYAVFGNVGATGLATLNKIATGGIMPGTDPQTGQQETTDGKPKLPVTITKAAVSG